VVGGVVALVGGLVTLRHKRPVDGADRLAAAAAAAFLLPVAVQAIPEWNQSPGRQASPLTPGLVEALREQVPQGDVVFSDPETSYRIAATTPVYVASAPPGHVADTEENRPYERRDAARRFFETGEAAILHDSGADWLVLDRDRFDITPQLDSVYRDDRYTLYVVP
jgi:hypothetical protein